MGIRDTSYYGWKTIDFYGPSPREGIIRAAYHDITVDVSGAIYVVGVQSGSVNNSYDHQWVVRKSNDSGETWKNIDTYSTSSDGSSGGNTGGTTWFSAAKTILIDSSGAIYVGGKVACVIDNFQQITGVIRKSHITSSLSWEKLSTFYSTSKTGSLVINDLSVDSTGTLFAVGLSSSINSFVGDSGSWIVWKSTNKGTSWSLIDSIPFNHAGNIIQDGFGGGYANPGNGANGIVIDKNDKIYVCGQLSGSGSVIRSSSDNGTTWASVDVWNGNNGTSFRSAASKIAISSDDVLFCAGEENYSSNNMRWIVRSSSDGTTGSWGIAQQKTGDFAFDGYINSLAFASDKTLYYGGILNLSTVGTTWVLDKAISGSLTNISTDVDIFADAIRDRSGSLTSIYITPNDTIFTCGFSSANNYLGNGNITPKYAIIRRGKLSSNSASFGPRLLAPSFGYVKREMSGTTEEAFNLNNVSEFPHSSGLFQMKNMVLGTISQGRVGKTDDSIIQKRFIGSFVRVLFPRQDDTDVRGYDIARQPGKLKNEWQFGDVINIEGKNFDHIALNCYIKKEVSGTLDSVLVRVETKPLNDIGFTLNQTVEQTISSSYISETVYRDELHRKDVDYGDLSLTEIAWKIDVDLKNVKEIRIATKHKNGQSDDKNKQCLIVGRFIKSDKNHEET